LDCTILHLGTAHSASWIAQNWLDRTLRLRPVTGAALVLAERGNRSPVLASEIKKIGTRDGKMRHWLAPLYN